MISTITFYAAFVAFLTIYAIVRSHTRLGMLCYVVAASMVFFYVANARLFALLPCTVVLSWAMTEEMRRRQGHLRQALLTVTIVLELFPLLYYKYTNFGLQLLSDLLQSNFAPLDIALPVGISFYTFQAISYTVDVYRQEFRMRATLLEYAFYLTFFPLLLAGPITRAHTLIPQLKQHRSVDARLLWTGLWLIIVGLLKKFVVADYLSQFNNWVFDDPLAYSGLENVMASLGYTLQIYCDFSGYSDLSIGMAAMMGFRLDENFRFPYQATTVAEFWHRWHISLSTWFRDYIYIPLGGNRRSRARTYINNMVTMIVAGVWHGASLMFVLWGAMHGVALVVQKMWSSAIANWHLAGKHADIPSSSTAGTGTAISNLMGTVWNVCCWLMTMTFIICSFVIFRATDIGVACDMFRQMAAADIRYLIPFIQARPLWVGMIIVATLVHAMRQRHLNRLRDAFVASPWLVKLLLVCIALQLAIEFHNANVQAFIYMNF